MSEVDKLVSQLHEALGEAKEHLEYCGYGDSWERECAKESGLENKINSALFEAEKYLEEKSE